jgi:hypothetical protein
MSRVPYVSSEPLLTDAKFQYDTVSSFAKAFDDGRFRVDGLIRCFVHLQPNSISMLQSRPPKKLVRPGLAQETNKTVASSSRSSGRSYLTARCASPTMHAYITSTVYGDCADLSACSYSLHAATHSVGSSGELELREILEVRTVPVCSAAYH